VVGTICEDALYHTDVPNALLKCKHCFMLHVLLPVDGLKSVWLFDLCFLSIIKNYENVHEDNTYCIESTSQPR